jgi:glycosyltransferase involved in cell wall biosynthesis
MDWIANQDAMAYWFESIWPIVVRECPGATMTIAGRNPSHELLSFAARSTNIQVTGSVPDVRPYLRRATVSIMPFRIGGGTRMKAYESMASGVPIVSTSIGIEGLPVSPGAHYLLANEPEAFAESVVRLIQNGELRTSLSRAARSHVEAEGSFQNAADDVSSACDWVTGARGA